MSFHVEPDHLGVLSTRLLQAYTDTADAKTYVQAYGTFSFHQTGVIGVLSGAHADLMDKLDDMLGHLQILTHSSSTALNEIAQQYEESDADASARLDASYPRSPRPAPSRD